jgi:hypothetical protein
VQVIGSGFGCTVTRSTKDALEVLGSRAVRVAAIAGPLTAGAGLSRRWARR